MHTYSLTHIYVSSHLMSPHCTSKVIIDTGSHHTAFPCVGCSCGKHLDPPFDPSRSSTAKTHTCNGKNRCIFKQAYSEGSSWSAYKIEDEAYMGTQVMNMPDIFFILRVAYFGV